MAQRIEIKTITIPNGTAKATPQNTSLVWREGYPIAIEIFVPPGPAGLVGIQLLHSDTVIIPHDGSEFLITDNEKVIWPLEGFPTAPNYKIRAYNTDVFDHTIQVRMLFAELGSPPITSAPTPIILPAWASVPNA